MVYNLKNYSIYSPKLYGNIVTNLRPDLVVPNQNFFEVGARYTFQSDANQDICNPTAIAHMFMSAGNMLYHLGIGKYGGAIIIYS